MVGLRFAYNLDGKEVTLNILGKGELFEMAALDEALAP